MSLILGAIISAAGSYAASRASANGQRDAAQAGIDNQQAQQRAARDSALGLLDQALGGGFRGFGADDIFGSRAADVRVPGIIDGPADLVFNPIDQSAAQLDSIFGNIAAFPAADQLTRLTNDSIVSNDLSRANALFPNFNTALDRVSQNTIDLLSGRLPFDDVMDIVSDRQALAGSVNAPGGATNATLRDLGISRLDAMNQGANLFGSTLANLNANVSPVSAQLRPQQFFLDPQNFVNNEISQEGMRAQSALNLADLESRPDPAAAGAFNLQLAAETAGAGADTPFRVPSAGGGAGQIAGLLGQSLGGLMMQRPNGANTVGQAPDPFFAPAPQGGYSPTIYMGQPAIGGATAGGNNPTVPTGGGGGLFGNGGLFGFGFFG